MFSYNSPKGIVEQVRDGSTLRVLLLPSFQVITVLLSGIKAPAVRKDVPEMEDLVEPFGEEVPGSSKFIA
jgi:staphylococcal nuclease domain-containing protein 1